MNAFQKILEDAVESGADSIELEYVSEGLEVTYMSGYTGFGHVISDRELVGELISAVVDKADLERSRRGTIHLEISNQPYTISVEEYDSFGESAFRLFLKRQTTS